MRAKLQRYWIPFSLVVRVALAAANGAAQTHPDSEPATAPERPPVSTPTPRVRTTPSEGEESRPSANVVKGPPLTLYHGEVQVLDLPNVARIAVGNGAVLRATVVASNQVVLIGEAAGTTSLRVWTRNGTELSYEVAVRSFDIWQVRDAQDLLA
jgi:Flp pilus assembly secretin CpaC